MASLEPSEEEAGDVEDAEDTPLLELMAVTPTRRAWLTCILVMLLAALLILSLTGLASAKLRTTQEAWLQAFSTWLQVGTRMEELNRLEPATV